MSQPPNADTFAAALAALAAAAPGDGTAAAAGAAWQNTWENHAELVRARVAAALARARHAELDAPAAAACQVHILDLTQGGHPVASAVSGRAADAGAHLLASPDDPEPAWHLASQCCPPAAYFNFHRQLENIRKSRLAARVRTGRPLSNLPRFLREHVVSFLYQGPRALGHMNGSQASLAVHVPRGWSSYRHVLQSSTGVLELGRAGKFLCTGYRGQRTDAGCLLLAAIGVSSHNKGSGLCAAFSNTLCVLVGVGKHAHAKAAITAAQQEVMGAVDFYAEAGY